MYNPIVDEALFPPPPPPARGQLAGRSGDLAAPADGGTPKDLEREAFNAELDRVAAALEKVCCKAFASWQTLQCVTFYIVENVVVAWVWQHCDMQQPWYLS